MLYHTFAYDPCCVWGGMAEYQGSYLSFQAAQDALFPGRYDLDEAQIVVEYEDKLVTVATRSIADDGENEVWTILRPELIA